MSDVREGLLFPNLLTRSERRELDREPEHRFLYQSMGAGWQSTAIALLAAQGVIEKPRFAVFADTGWEPPEVYAHLSRLDEEVLAPAGITLVRVRAGNIYDEAVDPHFPRSLPLYTRDPKTGEPGGITSRACTTNFKLIAIYRWLREQLGAPVSERACGFCGGKGERNAPWLVKCGHENPWGICSVCRGLGAIRKVGAPPRGVWARAYVGFSADEMDRISPSRVGYAFDMFPLVGRDQNGDVVPPDLSMSRQDCGEFNTNQGFPDVMKSACIGCPWHSDSAWIRIKQNEQQWRQVVELDRSIRNTPGLDNESYLHKSRIPIEDVTFESGDDEERPSCSPYGCPSGLATDSIAPPSLFDDDWVDWEEMA